MISQNLKIYIDQEQHELYDRLTQRGGENPDDHPFQTMKDLFMVSACLGAKYNRFKDLKKPKDIFSSSVFDPKIDIPVLVSIAYGYESKFEILLDENEMISIVQGYACGGFEILKEKLIQSPGRLLDNLINTVLNI